jgi:FkbM family methyltransferase
MDLSASPSTPAKIAPGAILRALAGVLASGKAPSRRALATLARLGGRRLERRWPFLRRAGDGDAGLGFADLLEFQYARSRRFRALVVGAFDGLENDPACDFIRRRGCEAILVEPQPRAFERLRGNLGGRPGIVAVNAAVDEAQGRREMYVVAPDVPELPAWTEQLASFSRAHVESHEKAAPGLRLHIEAVSVPTVTFGALLDAHGVRTLDLLQTDAEGMDARLLGLFPFERCKPGLVYYETTHMAPAELAGVRAHLAALGYLVMPSDSTTDDMAVLA